MVTQSLTQSRFAFIYRLRFRKGLGYFPCKRTVVKRGFLQSLGNGGPEKISVAANLHCGISSPPPKKICHVRTLKNGGKIGSSALRSSWHCPQKLKLSLFSWCCRGSWSSTCNFPPWRSPPPSLCSFPFSPRRAWLF